MAVLDVVTEGMGGETVRGGDPEEEVEEERVGFTAA